jgi:hypothetical protein
LLGLGYYHEYECSYLQSHVPRLQLIPTDLS